jgi:hypothetical protein
MDQRSRCHVLQVIQNMLKVSSTTLLDPKTLDIMVDPVSRVCPTMHHPGRSWLCYPCAFLRGGWQLQACFLPLAAAVGARADDPVALYRTCRLCAVMVGHTAAGRRSRSWTGPATSCQAAPRRS